MPYGPKPPDLDDDYNPIGMNRPPDIEDTPEEKTWFQSLTEPIWEGPRQAGKWFANYVDQPHEMYAPTGEGGWKDTARMAGAMTRGFFAGTAEGIGGVLSDLTSPADLGATALGAGGIAATARGLPKIGRALAIGSNALNIPGAAHGAQTMLNPNATLAERGFGLAEAAGNIAGLASPMPGAKPKVRGTIPESLDEYADLFDSVEEGQMPSVRAQQPPDYTPPNAAILRGPASQTRNIPVAGGAARNIARSVANASDRPPDLPEVFDMGDINQYQDMPQEYIQNELLSPIDEMRYAETQEATPFPQEDILGGLPPPPEIPQGLPTPVPLSERLSPGVRATTPTTLPHEFSPDVRMSQEPVPELGGVAPKFTSMADDQMPSSMLPDEGIDRARTAGGKVQIGADIGSLGKVLGSSLYQGDVATIATKEMVQNSLDAIRELGPAGRVDLAFDRKAGTINVDDNGKGLTPDDIATIFTDLGSSGKRADESAIGGFGLAKASFLLGGKGVHVESIAIDPKTGNKIRTILSGTPDELLAGVHPEVSIVDVNTPTGTKIKLQVDPDSSMYDAREFVEAIGKHSNIEGQVRIKNQYRAAGDPNLYEPIQSTARANEPLTTLSTPSGNLEISVPPGASRKDVHGIKIVYANKGMYQNFEYKGLGEAVDNVPSEIVINVDSLVPEGHADYPFTANRETLRGTVKAVVNKYIDEELLNPARRNRSDALKAAYVNMPKKSVGWMGGDGSKVDIYYHDTGSRYAPEELQAVMDSEVMDELGLQIHSSLKTLKAKFAGEDWADRLESIGFVFDDTLKGIHIPNPGEAKSRILINPFQLMASKPPDAASAGFVHVILHEFAHVDPHAGRGHNESFTIRLSEVYEKFGAKDTVRAQDDFLAAVTEGEPDSGEYSPEIQNLLQGYIDSRRRSIVKEDILSGTGVSSKASSQGPGGIPPRGKPDGDRTFIMRQPNLEAVKKAAAQGFIFTGKVRPDGAWEFKKGKIPPEAAGGRTAPILETEVGQARPTARHARAQLGPETNVKQSSNWLEAYNLARGMKASIDLSAPLRQGIGLIHKKEFWRALKPMLQSWASEEGFQMAQKRISDRALFRARVGRDGKMLPSFAADAGLHLTDLKDLSTREEQIASTWAEKVPGVRPSNRAYTAFLNTLRADVFENLVKDGAVFGADAKVNLPLARALANFTNVASGRGSLGPLESSAKTLGVMMFSPRLMASRLKMLDPRFYVTGPKQVRQEAIKSLFAIAGAGNAVTQLLSMAGADVDNDPNSSDFGKAQIGNTRLDPYAGFQQYIVAANRLIRPNSFAVPGMANTRTGVVPLDNAAGMMGTGGQQIRSTKSGNQYDLWNQTGPYDPTHLSSGARFLRGKAHPVLGLAFDILGGMKDMTGQELNFTSMNPMENTITQQFIPLFLQDIYEVSQQNPELLPITIPASGLGMGVQSYSEEDR